MDEFDEKMKKEENTNKEKDIILFIQLPFKRELTPDEKEKYVGLTKEAIPNKMSYAIHHMIKEYLLTGKIMGTDEFIKAIEAKPIKIHLSALPDEKEDDDYER